MNMLLNQMKFSKLIFITLLISVSTISANATEETDILDFLPAILAAASNTDNPETVFQLYPPDWGVNGYTENYDFTGTLKLNSEIKRGQGTYELEVGDLALPDAGVDTYSVSASIELEYLGACRGISPHGSQ